MKGPALEAGSSLQGAVAHAAAVTARVMTRITRLPAYASEDWCASAARAVLPLHEPSTATVMLASFDDQERLVSIGMLPGAAGSAATEIATGQRATSPAIALLDANHPDLVRLVGGLAEAREPGWGVPMSRHECRVISLRATLGESAWTSTPAGMRWTALGAADVLCGICALPSSPDVFVLAEIGLSAHPGGNGTSARFDPADIAIFEAVLPALAAAADRAAALGPDGPPVKTLTPKEVAILDLLIDGLSVAEIADKLGRSPHTVHDHVKSLHHKLGVRRRGQLVSRALGHVPHPER
jgi:DNA-binding CsgD family transcriptional regulator